MTLVLTLLRQHWFNIFVAISSAWTTYALMNYMDENQELKARAAVQDEVVQVLKRTAAATTEVLSQQVQVRTTIKERATRVQVEIEKRIPVDSVGCTLTPEWRLLHDSAATNNPVPDTPSGADAGPVTPKEAASTVASNYEVCLTNAEQLRGLQQWLKGVSK